MANEAAPERLLCDTSFAAHLQIRGTNPERYQHWPEADLKRIDAAILALSVVSLGEARFGYRKAKWGERRIAQEEKRLESFLWVPIDMDVVEEWGRLRHLCEINAWTMTHNDIWIAATASARGYPLVTSDKGQARIADPALEVILLPPPSA